MYLSRGKEGKKGRVDHSSFEGRGHRRGDNAKKASRVGEGWGGGGKNVSSYFSSKKLVGCVLYPFSWGRGRRKRGSSFSMCSGDKTIGGSCSVYRVGKGNKESPTRGSRWSGADCSLLNICRENKKGKPVVGEAAPLFRRKGKGRPTERRPAVYG